MLPARTLLRMSSFELDGRETAVRYGNSDCFSTISRPFDSSLEGISARIRGFTPVLRLEMEFLSHDERGSWFVG